MADPFITASSTLEQIAISASTVGGSLDLLSVSVKKTQEAFGRLMDIKIKLEALSKAGKQSTVEFKNLETQLESAAQELDANSRATAQLRNAHKSLGQAAKGSTDTFKKFSEGLNKSYGYAQKWLPMFGGMSITLKGAKDALVQYNASMFSLQRTYQASSNSVQDFSKTLKYVSANTKMSTNDFLDFAKSATQVWKGAQPNIQVFGELASTLQDKLGPSLQDVQGGLTAVSALMQKMPALGQSFVATANALRKAEEGGSKKDIKNATERSERLKKLIALKRQSGAVDRETAVTAAKALTPLTAEQKKQIDTNRKLAGVNRNMQDMQLKAGQQLEPLLNGITGHLETLTGLIKDMPLQIFKIVAAIKLVQMASSKIDLSGLGGKGGMSAVAGKGGILKNLLGGGAMSAGGLSRDSVAASLKSMPKENRAGALSMAQNLGVAGKAPNLGMAGKMLKGVKGGAGMSIIGGIIGGVTEYSERSSEGQDKGTAAKAGMTKGATIAASAAAGAALGSVIPGIGTVIGGLVGGVVGAFAGDSLGELITDKLWPEYNKATEEAKKLEEQSGKNETATLELAESIFAARENQRILTESTQQAYEAIRMQVDIMKEAGLINYGNVDAYYGKSIEQLKRMEDQAKTTFVEIARGMSDLNGIAISEDLANELKNIDGTELEVFFKGAGYEELVGSLQDRLSKLKVEKLDLGKKGRGTSDEKEQLEIKDKIANVEAEEAIITDKLSEAAKARNTIMTTGVKIVDETRAGINSQVDAIAKYNGAYEERLGLEKDLMESAQFGMGASVEMMQQQVDMAYNLINAEKERQSASSQALEIELSKAKVGQEQRNLSEDERKNVMGQLKGAKNIMQVQSIINSLGIKSEASAYAISKHTQDQVESTNNILKQQKKIYDITKDVREGYLDALQAMSVGAGEFEKIIGTQDMGASQLMDAVDKYNTSGEQGKLNTNKMGGRQSKDATSRGVGTELTGMISATAGGPTVQFESGDQAQAKNERLSGYRKNANDYYKDITGNGDRSEVGTGNAMTGNFAGAIEDSALNKDVFARLNEESTEKAVTNAILKTSGRVGGGDVMRGVNPSLQGEGGNGRGRYGEPGITNGKPRNMFMGVEFGAQVAAGAQTSSPADPSGFTRTGGGVGGVVQSYPVPANVAGTNPGLPTERRAGQPNPDYWNGVEKYNQQVSMIDPNATEYDASGTTWRNQNVPLLLRNNVSEEYAPTNTTAVAANAAATDKINIESDEGAKKAHEKAGKKGLDLYSAREKRLKEDPSYMAKFLFGGEGDSYDYMMKQYEEESQREKDKETEKRTFIGGTFAKKYQSGMSKFDDRVGQKMKVPGGKQGKSIGVGNRKQAEEDVRKEILEESRMAAQSMWGTEVSLSDSKKYGMDYLKEQQSAEKQNQHSGSVAVSSVTAKMQEDPEIRAMRQGMGEEKQNQHSGSVAVSSVTAKMQEDPEIRAMRQGMGERKGASSKDLYKSAMGEFSQNAAWEKYTPEERQKMQEKVKKASELKYVDEKENQRQLNVATQAYGGGIHSAAQEKGFEASQAQQAAMSSAKVQQGASETFGAVSDSGGGGGGGGTVKVVVQLEAGLAATFEQHGNVITELTRAAK